MLSLIIAAEEDKTIDKLIVDVNKANEVLVQQKQRDKDSFAQIEHAHNEAYFNRIEQNIIALAKPMESCANSACALNSAMEATT